MPKLRRKSSVCYNCGEQLVNSENYCPNCGQENHNRQASTSLLIKDFVDTCLSFDSKLFMTMRPLLFQPGTLSKEYLDGKRVKFVPPIRLFIFLSFLYFGISLVIGGSNGFDVSVNNTDITTEKGFAELFQRNINLMIFLFTPLHALVVMLFFRSKERSYYVNFFVFTLHLFSFFFSLGILLRLLVVPVTLLVANEDSADTIASIIQFGLIIYLLVYSVIALKRTFNKKYTIPRFIGTIILNIAPFLLTFIGYLALILQFSPVNID